MTSSSPIRAAVYGASGYGGGELLRILAGHPRVEVVQATSRDPDRTVPEVHAHLRGVCDLQLTLSDPDALDPDLDAVFTALPHGESTGIMADLARRCPDARIYDLARDFRTGAEAEGWVYGQPELFADAIREARRVACPGCFATAILLGTAPAIRAGVPLERIVVDAKTGSSGSGASPRPLTHHPTRVGTLRAYKVFDHQHTGEIVAAWDGVADGPDLPPLAFCPQSTPLVRGIYACSYLMHPGGEVPADVEAIYRETYAGSPFCRVVDGPPNVVDVRGTNRADVYCRAGPGLTLVISAIDNLVRGAAGQAVQCMNLGFGLAEDEGLRLAGLVP